MVVGVVVVTNSRTTAIGTSLEGYQHVHTLELRRYECVYIPITLPLTSLTMDDIHTQYAAHII